MRQKIFSAREEQLIKANKSLYILRTLPKEGFNQSEIDPLFNTIVLPSAAGLVSGIRRSDHAYNSCHERLALASYWRTHASILKYCF